jgi:hypothetical protein
LLWGELNDAYFLQFFRQLHEQAIADLWLCLFATTKLNGYLHLVATFEEAIDMRFLGLIIMRLDLWT